MSNTSNIKNRWYTPLVLVTLLSFLVILITTTQDRDKSLPKEATIYTQEENIVVSERKDTGVLFASSTN